MLRILKEIFPQHVVEHNFNHPDMTLTFSRRKVQLDAFINSLAIAFEHQGERHYGIHTWGHIGRIRQNDTEKMELCKRNGITLLQVPFWWDMTKEQLEAAIWKVRPDLITGPVKLSLTEQKLRLYPSKASKST
jgi:hypothetical protein